jgi:hypothetical protein
MFRLGLPLFCAALALAGTVELKSAGQLAFGPKGVLFVGDSAAAKVYAIETGDTSVAAAKPFEVKAINEKVAAMLGATPDQILIADAVVNPISKNVYLSVARGKGPGATALLLKVDASGKIAELPVAKLKASEVSLVDAPSEDAKDRRGQSLRTESITDLAFVDGKVFVAGLSNEEFSSSLRSIPYPFNAAAKAASIEIFHGAHGRFETNAPVRTFVPFTIDNQPHILAAYTCTPLVKIPVSELKPGNKVKGATIAELGNRNRPLDMIVYNKDGQQYILMANSSRGVMKLPTAKIESYPSITAQTEKQGVPYETIATLKGVQQLDKLDDKHALMLLEDSGTLDLRAVPLP